MIDEETKIGLAIGAACSIVALCLIVVLSCLGQMRAMNENLDSLNESVEITLP